MGGGSSVPSPSTPGRRAIHPRAIHPPDGTYAVGRASGGSTPQSMSWSVSSPGVMS
jgi:hypothetical protein